MKKNKILSLVLAVVLIFSVTAVPTRIIAEQLIDTTDAVFIGKSGTTNNRVANIFYPLTATKATLNGADFDSNTYFKLTFKAKMLSGSSPIVGYIKYNKYSGSGGATYAMPSNVYNGKNKTNPNSNCKYSYDASTGLCEVIFKPVIDSYTKQGPGGVYGWLTIGNSERKFQNATGAKAEGSLSLNIDEYDFDNSFIMTEPKLYAYNGSATYGDNLINGFDSTHIDFAGSYQMWWDEYGRPDTFANAKKNCWHIDTSEYLINSIRVPSDYFDASYNAQNFVKHSETDYTREYYTNSYYSGVNFIKLKNSNDMGFAVVDDLNKKMIIIDANREGFSEGTHDKSAANRCANLVIPVNIDQYKQSAGNFCADGNVYLKVTMKARRLEGSGAPILGRIYGKDKYDTGAHGTYCDNVGTDSKESNCPSTAAAKYNATTGEYVGYVRMYTCSSDQETAAGHTEYLTIGNAEHEIDNDIYDITSFNSSFAITDIKVDLINTDSRSPRTLSATATPIASDITPPLVAENIDTTSTHYYHAFSRMSNSGYSEEENAEKYLKYDCLATSHKVWSVDGATDLIWSENVSKCMAQKQTNGSYSHTLSYHSATDSTIEYWTCNSCGNKKFSDCRGTNEIGDDISKTNKMITVNGESKDPNYVAIPLKVRGYLGTAYFRFTCKMKLKNADFPKVSIYLPRREGQLGGATKDSDTEIITQSYDEQTLVYSAIISIWRPQPCAQRNDHLPFFYIEPNNGNNALLVIGNSEHIGGGYEANKASFAIADPELVRVNDSSLSSSVYSGAQNIIAPITDKTTDFSKNYSLGDYSDSSYSSSTSPLTAPTNTWIKMGDNLSVSDIPEKYFSAPMGLDLDSANGTISTFVTLKNSKKYRLSFNSKYVSAAEAKPFIEYIDSLGSKEKVYLDYISNQNDVYNTICDFTAPDSLRLTKNARIGVEISSGVKGILANFMLNELGASDETDNLITNGTFGDFTTSSFVSFGDSVSEGKWMLEGSIGSSKFVAVSNLTFVKTSAKMIGFAGKNDDSATAKSANDGRPKTAYIRQAFSLSKGKKYRLSFNAKYVQSGTNIASYKLGASFEYKKGTSASFTDCSSASFIAKTVSNTEYKETYDITMPTDLSSASDNFRFTFNFCGAFVSGYAANFELYEVNGIGNTVGENIFSKGDFGGETFTPGWEVSDSSTYYKLVFGDIPDFFFSKNGDYKPNMLYLQNSSDWSGMFIQPMYKPATRYEFCYDYLLTDYASDMKPYTTASQFRMVSGEFTNDSMADSEWTVTETAYNPSAASTDPRTSAFHVSKKFTTANSMRLYGNNDMIIRFYMRKDSSGFWGNFGIYELNSKGERISGNLFLDGDFACGTKLWEYHGDLGKQRVVEQPQDFFSNWRIPETMVYSNGTETDSEYKTTLTVDDSKEYILSMKYLAMNSVGTTPQIKYLAVNDIGETEYRYMTLETDYDAARFIMESVFTLPDDAVVQNGKAEITLQLNNTDGGKAYFTNVMLTEADKYYNLLPEFTFEGNNYSVMPYNKDVFAIYTDDSKFDDGEWFNEFENLNLECGKNLTHSYDKNTNTLYINGYGDMYDFPLVDEVTGETLYFAPWRDYAKDIKNIVVGNDVTSIGDRAFAECYKLKNISLPEGIKSIGRSAFDSCFNLESITLPLSATKIKERAFYRCVLLKSVWAAASAEISSDAFERCPKDLKKVFS
ncbi:MAG: leucine-rich repeat domain-containing protein [Clostridia bacterium]|nr:leucine-rich repeat domain-containing protein [Clostridia bacterium]